MTTRTNDSVQRNRELPCAAKSNHGFATWARSWTTLSRNMNLPRELSQTSTTNSTTMTIAPGNNEARKSGVVEEPRPCPCRQVHQVAEIGLAGARPSAGAIPPMAIGELRQERRESTTNHFLISNGSKSAFFIRLHPRPSGSK